MSAVARKLPDPDMFDDVCDPSPEAVEAAKALEAWACSKPRRAKPKTMREDVFVRATNEAREMMSTGDWSNARPTHFVALFCILHEKVYGIAPALTARDKKTAAAVAGAMLKHPEKFAGDANEMASFILWTWKREKGREEWRRKNGRSGGSITWGAQFNGAIFTDWRIDVVRRG